MVNKTFELIIDDRRYNVTNLSSNNIPAQQVKASLTRVIQEKGQPILKKSFVKIQSQPFEVVPISTQSFIVAQPNLIEVHKSVFTHIIDCFRDFISWITGNPRVEKVDPLEMTFAMHLFRQADSRLYSKILGTGTSIAENLLSLKLDTHSTFEIWRHFLSEMTPYLSTEEQEEHNKFLGILNQIIEVKSKIVELRSIRRAEDRKLATAIYAEEIFNKANLELEIGKTVYLPGGYVQDGEIPGIGSGLMEFPMIYEVKKKPEGDYAIRIIDFSKNTEENSKVVNPGNFVWDKVLEVVDKGVKGLKVCGSYTGTIKEVDLRKFFNDNLRCQVGPENILKHLKPGLWNIIKAGWYALRGIGKDELQNNKRKHIYQDGVKKFSLEHDLKSNTDAENPECLSTKLRLFTEPEKLFELFMKRISPKFYTRSKSLMKVAAFQILFKKVESKLDDEQVRGWIRSNAHSLLSTLKKHDSSFNAVEKAEIKTALEDIISKINDNRLREVPSAPNDQKSNPTGFKNPLAIAPVFAPLDTFKKRSVNASPIAPEPPSLDDKVRLKNWMNAKIKTCRKLANTGSFETLDFHLQESFQVLRLLIKQDYFVNLQPEDTKEWSQIARELGFLTADCSYGLRRIVPYPHHIDQILTSLRVSENIFQISEKDKINKIKAKLRTSGFGLDLGFVKFTLLNPYLNVGPYNQSILDNLRSMHKETRIELVTAIESENHGYINAQGELYHQYDLPKKFSKDGEVIPQPEAIQDIGQYNLLPKELANLRQLYILTQVLLAPTRVGIVQGGGGYLGTAAGVINDINIEEMFNGDENYFNVIQEKIFQQIIKDILTRMSNNNGAIHLEFIRTIAFGEMFKIQPWDVGLRDFNYAAGTSSDYGRTSVQHPKLYDANGVEIDDKVVKERLFEQVVGESNLGHADSNGRNSENKHWNVDRYQKFGVKALTQQHIIREKLCLMGLPSDISQELELMMTGEKTRFKEALGKLSKYAELLNEPPIGPVLQRFFAIQILKAQFHENNTIEGCNIVAQFKQIAQKMEDMHAYRSYLFIVDISRNLEAMYPFNLDLKNLNQEFNEKTLAFSKQASEGKDTHVQYQYDFIRNTLLELANRFEKRAENSTTPPELTFEELKDTFEAYFVFNSQVGQSKYTDPIHTTKIRFLIYKLLHQTKNKLTDVQQRNILCNYIAKLISNVEPVNSNWESADNSGLKFRSGNLTLDFSKGIVSVNNVSRGIISEAVLSHASAEPILQMFKNNGVDLKDLKSLVANIHPIKKDNVEGLCYVFTLEIGNPKTAKTFRLIQVNDGSLRLYRMEPRRFLSDKWFQFVPSLNQKQITIKSSLEKLKNYFVAVEEIENFPRELTKYECWIRSNAKEMYCESNGKLKYKVSLSGQVTPSVVSIKDIPLNKTVKNPWNDPTFNIFTEIEDKSHVLALGSGSKIDTVKYNRFNLNYSWNEEKNIWASQEFKGYKLSTKSLDELVGNNEHPLFSAFPKTFGHYQILESEHAVPKLVITCNEYVMNTNEQDMVFLNLLKNFRRFTANFETDKASSRALFVFNIDPNKGLVLPNETPADVVRDAYLYLSYTMLIHGKYLESLEYLRKSDMNIPSSDLTKEIMKWMNKTLLMDESSSEGKALRMHYILMQMRHGQMLNPKAAQSTATQMYLALAAGVYMSYRQLVKSGAIPAGLRLNDVERLDFKRICEKSLAYIAFKIFSKKELIKALAKDFDEIDKILKKHQSENTDDLQKIQLIYQLSQKYQSNPAYTRYYKMITEKFHISFMELYDWYNTGVFHSMMESQLSVEDKLKLIIDTENKHQIRLKNSYKQEIANLKEKIRKDYAKITVSASSDADKYKAPLFEGSIFQNEKFFKAKRVDENLAINWNERFDKFQRKVRSNEISYHADLQNELTSDLEHYLKENNHISKDSNQVRANEKTETRLNIESKAELTQKIKEQQSILNAKALYNRRELLKSFKAPNQANEWQILFEKSKELNVHWQDILFNTALRCFGEQNWELLKDYVHPDEFVKFNVFIQNYLQSSIAEQQLAFALIQLQKHDDAIQKHTQNPDPKILDQDLIIIENDLYAALTRQWGYNPNIDPDRFAFLLIEHELGLVCRKNQILIVRDTLRDHNQFKQEICGGGKTTVLRVAISKLRADGKTLSAISTLDPLRKVHGPLFTRSTLHSYGEETFELKFSRKSPSDVASLLKLHRNLIAMVANGGRLDLTKGDLLSFKLEQTLKQEKIKTLKDDSPEWVQINEELDIMENIRDDLLTFVKINADELDKDCDPSQEKLYAHGERVPLNLQKIHAYIDFYSTASKSQSPHLKRFFSAIRSNQQSDLPQEVILGAREEYISILFDRYKADLKLDESQKELFKLYFTELGRNGKPIENTELSEINKFYQDFIAIKNGHDEESAALREKLCYLHEFLVDLMPHASRKVGGVNFIRAKDTIHVIPSEGSDKPKEGSEHGLDGEQICYTIMDYLDVSRDGISISQVQQIVIDQKKKAQNELEKLRLLNPNRAWDIEDTKVAKKFLETFKKSLTTVSEEDYSLLSREINNNTDLVLKFILDWVFPEYEMNTEKIISDSQDPPSMVKEYSGSSGTESSKYTLPDKINVKNTSQKGTHGEIIKSLLQIEATSNGQPVYIEREGSTANDYAKQLAGMMNGGDCLSEVGIFFRGIPAQKIAQMIWDHKGKPENIVMRFQDRQDQWKMLKKGEVVEVDDTIPLKNVITIFDDVHTRGSERPSTQDVKEFLTLSETTEWSRFEQGALRERGVTKQKAKIVYIITPGLAKLWNGRYEFENTITLLDKNETDSLKKLNLKAEKQRIVAIARHQNEIAARSMTRKSRAQGSNSHWKARALVYEMSRDYFVRKTQSGPENSGAPRGLCTPDQALDKLIQKEIDQLKAILIPQVAVPINDVKFIDNFTIKMEVAVDRLKAKFKTKLEDDEINRGFYPRLPSIFFPEKVPDRASELDNEQSVEQELTQEQELAQEQEQETSTEGLINIPVIPHLMLGISSPEILVKCLFENDNPNIYKLCNYADHQDPNIAFTENFSPVTRDAVRNVKPWGVLKPGEKLRPDQNRISRFIVGVDVQNNRVAALIPSLKDNDYELEQVVRSNNSQYRFSIYNLDTNRIDGGAEWESIPPHLHDAFKLAVIGVKFQNGEVEFKNIGKADRLEDQYSLLVEWIKKRNIDAITLEKSFIGFLSVYRPTTLKSHYSGSDLQQAFIQAKKR